MSERNRRDAQSDACPLSLERVMPCEKSDGARASTTLNCGTEPVLRSLNGRCGRFVALVLFLTYWLLLCVPADRRELGNEIEIEVEATVMVGH